MKSIEYKRHAKNRMRWHRISEQEIELAIEKPEHKESAAEGRSNVWIKISGKFLRGTLEGRN
jgi:hypothetical protein